MNLALGILNILRGWHDPRGSRPLLKPSGPFLRLSIKIRRLGTEVVGRAEAGLFSDRRENSPDYISSMGRLEPSFLGEFDPLVLTQVDLLGLGFSNVVGSHVD